jgi:hypothetical protein
MEGHKIIYIAVETHGKAKLTAYTLGLKLTAFVEQALQYYMDQLVEGGMDLPAYRGPTADQKPATARKLFLLRCKYHEEFKKKNGRYPLHWHEIAGIPELQFDAFASKEEQQKWWDQFGIEYVDKLPTEDYS